MAAAIKERLLKSFCVFSIIIILLLGILSHQQVYSERNVLKIHFIDVGYGDAIFIEFPDKKNLLIDSGEDKYSPQFLAYLESLGIQKIDIAILTHPHDNHFGGFIHCLDKYLVGRFYLNGDDKASEKGYTELTEKLKEKDIPLTVLRRGDKIDSGVENVQIQILHPADLTGSANENSIVTWLTFGETSFLFTADIKKPQQKELISLYPEIKSADCIQAPHHGGKISKKFANFFENKVFVVSTGENEYNKPFPEELSKLQGKILRTDQLGSITLESDGKQVKVVNE